MSPSYSGVELRAVLVRRVEPEHVLKILNIILRHMNVVGEGTYS